MPRFERSVWILALVAAALHMSVYAHAELATPPGWSFSGNIHSSPDFVQYRTWPRQTVDEGPVVANVFTVEDHEPYLPVLTYWGIGLISQWTNLSPEWVFAWLGAVLAFVLTLVLVAVVRAFVAERVRAWWIIGVIMLGGGLGAHAKFAKWVVGGLGGGGFVEAAEGRISGPGAAWVWFEDYRGHYVFTTLFDTHFLVIWVLATLAVFTYWRALSTPSTRNNLIAAAVSAVATLIHIYEGPTLVMIIGAVTLLWWIKGFPMRPALTTAATLTITIGVCVAGLLMLQRGSGLPMPGWRALAVLTTILAAAYPVAWGLMAWGGIRYWLAGKEKEVFLLGWTLGCVALTLSAPFYPYPDRGTMTLQIPIYIIAGTIFFDLWGRVTLPALVVGVGLLGFTPVWTYDRVWGMGSFSEEAPHKFLSDADLAVVEALESRSEATDVILAEEDDVLWLAPRFEGRHYCGHFFLTIDFDTRCTEVWDAFRGTAAEQQALLDKTSARFVYTRLPGALATLPTLPGIREVARSERGALFEYDPQER